MLVHGNAPTPDLHFRYGMPSFRSCLHWVVRLDHRRLKTGCALSRGKQMAALGIAFGMLAAIWILVLLDSPYFGPRDH
jgi:hypothetical protein